MGDISSHRSGLNLVVTKCSWKARGKGAAQLLPELWLKSISISRLTKSANTSTCPLFFCRIFKTKIHSVSTPSLTPATTFPTAKLQLLFRHHPQIRRPDGLQTQLSPQREGRRASTTHLVLPHEIVRKGEPMAGCLSETVYPVTRAWGMDIASLYCVILSADFEGPVSLSFCLMVVVLHVSCLCYWWAGEESLGLRAGRWVKGHREKGLGSSDHAKNHSKTSNIISF